MFQEEKFGLLIDHGAVFDGAGVPDTKSVQSSSSGAVVLEICDLAGEVLALGAGTGVTDTKSLQSSSSCSVLDGRFVLSCEVANDSAVGLVLG